MIVIIPTRRSISLDYLRPALDAGARIIVVDDTPGTIKVDHPQVEVYNWADKERIAGPWIKAFPGLNGACMSFGFYLAWRDAGDDEMILTLGDDCRLDLPDFVEKMENALSPREAPVAKTDGRFINYVELLKDCPPNLFTRGFPYSDRIGHSPFEIGESVKVHPSFNLGLCQNVQDINAIDKIRNKDSVLPSIELKCSSVVIPPGKFVSVSSGNMQFRRRLIPIVYQLPMHFEVAPDWVVSRFGDIWAGFIMKALMDKAGDDFTIGDPWVHHVFPGDVTVNIWKEHIGIMVNDAFVALLDDSLPEVRVGAYADMVGDLAEAFQRRVHQCPRLLAPYITHLCDAWDSWLNALKPK
jgi:Reversibly glycosylated polypeptide